MTARREIYMHPMGEVTIVKRLRVEVTAEMFYRGRLWGRI
jgi:hypothetical protein